MATYTHFEVEDSSTDDWFYGMGASFAASNALLQFSQHDGTVTKAHGAFVLFQNIVIGGVISSLEHTSADGTITYETLTGTSIDALAFLFASGKDRATLAFAGQDDLTGHSGRDDLDGGPGADVMAGGQGQDHYTVDNPGDVVLELPDGGYDIVATTLSSYALGPYVENLFFWGVPGGVTGYGNDLNNQLTSMFGAGTLYGFGGNDTLSGDFSHTMKNVLVGGPGDDRYEDVGVEDTIVELPNEGYDTVEISIPNYVLPENFEGMDLAAGVTAYGNGADNKIEVFGSSGAHVYGLGGNDHFFTGFGTHTLDGGDGDDTTYFNNSIDKFTVTDFGNKIVVASKNGGDTLISVEHLEFFTKGAIYTVTPEDDSALFDTLFYMHNNVDVLYAGANALAHFNASGWHEGRDPNAFFSVNGYLAVNPDVAGMGLNPLDHYDQSGWKEGRDPGANFDTTLYLIHNPDVAAANVDPLAHYLQSGMAEGRQAYQAIGQNIAGGFDAEYYLLHNPDVAAAHVDPLQHFNTVGWHEGRNPNAFFDSAGYLAYYKDVAAAGVNPLVHYEQSGWLEGRDPSANFDTLGYLAVNPDVAAAHINPLDHYLQTGIYEDRAIVNDGMWH